MIYQIKGCKIENKSYDLFNGYKIVFDKIHNVDIMKTPNNLGTEGNIFNMTEAIYMILQLATFTTLPICNRNETGRQLCSSLLEDPESAMRHSEDREDRRKRGREGRGMGKPGGRTGGKKEGRGMKERGEEGEWKV